MEKFRPEIKAEMFLPEEWYFNDDVISDIYLKLDSKELSDTTIDHMFEEAENKLRSLLKIGSENLSREQLEQVTILDNVIRELHKHSSHYRTAHKTTEHGAMDLGDTVH